MSRREQDPPPRHPVDPSRRRRIEDPEQYEQGRRDGDADREQQQGKFHTDGDTPNFVGHCRRPLAIAAAVALLVCFPVALPLAAFLAVALLAAPRSGHVGTRHRDARHQAGSWGGDRAQPDTASADDGPCCPAGNPTTTPSSKGRRT